MKNEKVFEALRQLDFGYQVIPFSQDKNFFLVKWKQAQTERLTAEQVESWWETFPNANVGIITGELSGITVIDFDTGIDGNLSEEQLTIIKQLPTTLTVRTPSGGYHLYYKYNKKIKQTSFVNLKIDIRNDGGLIGGWDNYCEYTKSSGRIVKGWYRIVDKKGYDIEELSDETYNNIFNLKVSTKEVAEYEQTDWTQLPNNHRNDYFFKFACSMFSRKMRKPEVVDYFKLKYNSLTNKVDFSWQEVMTIIESASKFEIHDIKKTDMSGYKGEDEIQSSLSVLEEVRDKVKGLRFLPTGFASLDNLCHGGLLQNDFVLLTGEAKSGKSDLCLQLVQSMEVYSPLYLTLEDSIVDQQVRKLFLYGQEETKEYNIVTSNPEEFTLDWVLLRIKESIDKKKTKIIFIDNLDWIKEVRDNYKKSVEVIMKIKKTCDQFQVCIVLVAHLGLNRGVKMGVARPDAQMLKGGAHLYQMGTKVISVWRMFTTQGKNDVVEVGCTTVTLALDRFGGKNNQEMFLKYEKGRYLEIKKSERDTLMDKAKNSRGEPDKEVIDFFMPKMPQILDN